MLAHFTPETFRFLRGLTKNNERGWFEERRPVYERAVKAPLLALVTEVNEALAEFAPEYVRAPHKIAMRIFRDTRFSPDKRPYKTQVAAWWAREGLQKSAAAGYFMQVGPQGGMLAAGIYAPEREELLRVRRWMAQHHARYRELRDPLLHAGDEGPAMEVLAPNALTRNPKGFAADDPAAELLRARNWGVSLPLAAEEALQASFGERVAAQFRRTHALVEALNEPFLEAKPTASFRL